MRKAHFVIAWLFASTCFLCAAVGDSSAAEKSYPMVCRGGGQMSAHLVKSTERDIAGTWTVLDIKFSKARNAGTGSKPGPGECAWMDRPVGGNEPSILELRVGFLTPVDFYDVVIERGQVGLQLKEEFAGKELGQISNAIQRGGLFYVHCYQRLVGRQRSLLITRVGI